MITIFYIYLFFGQVDENEDGDNTTESLPETTESASTPFPEASTPFPDHITTPPFVSTPTTQITQERKPDDANDAAMALSSPSEEDNEFISFGRYVGFELQKIYTETPNQSKIAKELISEVIFLASMDMLNVNSYVIN